jgi:hypothetical protein
MKVESKKELFIEMTPEQAAAINGGKHGADDPAGDDRGRGQDDAPGHG